MEIAPRLLGNIWHTEPDSKIITLYRHRDRESFFLVDLMSSVNVEKVRGFVEDGAKFLYTSDDITISLLPYLITGVILLLGGNLRRLHSSKCSV